MEELQLKAQDLIQKTGIAGYFGLAAIIIIFAVSFVSVYLAIGMFIYSIFSKNWAVWKKWKYMGWLLLLGIGLLLVSIIIKFIAALLGNLMS